MARDSAGFPDAAYAEKGARIAESHAQLFAEADVVLQVRSPGAAGEAGRADAELLRPGQTIIGFSEPLGAPAAARDVAERGVSALSMELIPRITRAQSMDALSSMATIAGYKAVLLAADGAPPDVPDDDDSRRHHYPRARYSSSGPASRDSRPSPRPAGSGARVEAYDVRPAVKEQVESLGASTSSSCRSRPRESPRTPAATRRRRTRSFYQRQRETMARVVANERCRRSRPPSIPGKTAPILVTAEMPWQGCRPAR